MLVTTAEVLAELSSLTDDLSGGRWSPSAGTRAAARELARASSPDEAAFVRALGAAGTPQPRNDARFTTLLALCAYSPNDYAPVYADVYALAHALAHP